MDIPTLCYMLMSYVAMTSLSLLILSLIFSFLLAPVAFIMRKL